MYMNMWGRICGNYTFPKIRYLFPGAIFSRFSRAFLRVFLSSFVHRSEPHSVELLCRQQRDAAACSYTPVYFPDSDINSVIPSSFTLSSDVRLDVLRGEVRLLIGTEGLILGTAKPQHLTPTCSKQHCKGIRSSGGQAELVEMAPSFRDLLSASLHLTEHLCPCPASAAVVWSFLTAFPVSLVVGFWKLMEIMMKSAWLLSQEE